MQLLKGTSILFIVTAISALVSSVTGIWIRNILGPEQYGVWLVFSMILMYGYYTHLGILDGFSRDVPRLLGEKNTLRVQRIRNIVFTWMMSSGVLAILLIFLIIFLPLSHFETILSAIAVMLIPFQNMALFHNQLFLTTQQFNKVAVIQLMIGSVQYVLMAFMAVIFGIYGLFLGVLAGNALAIVFSLMNLPYRLRLRWDGDVLKEMLSYGVPIMLIGVLTSLLTTLDRLIVYLFFGAAAAGHYGVIAFIYQGIMVLPGVFHQIMYPKINYTYGETKEKNSLKTIIVRPAMYVSYISPFFLGSLTFLFPPFAAMLMPEYVEGIQAARIVIPGLFFWLWAALYAQYLICVNKQWTYFKILLSAVFINIGTTVLLFALGFYIEGAAVGSVSSLICCPLFMMWAVFKDMGEKPAYFLKCTALVSHPFLLMVTLIVIVHHIPVHFLIQTSLFCLLYALVLFAYSFWIPSFMKARRNLMKGAVARLSS